MPVSDRTSLNEVVGIVAELRPESVLDVGIGWGKYGYLLRTVLESGYPDISDRSRWRVRIDGVEIFPPYVGAIQRACYSHIYLGDVATLVGGLDAYDVVVMGDVLEHFEKAAGTRLLHELLAKARKALVIVTPRGTQEQGEVLGNPHEEHRSGWTPRDFAGFPFRRVFTTKRMMLVVLSSAPLPRKKRWWVRGPFRLHPFPRRVVARLGSVMGRRGRA